MNKIPDVTELFFQLIATVKGELPMTWKTEVLTISMYYNNIFEWTQWGKSSGRIVGLRSRIEAVTPWILNTGYEVPFPVRSKPLCSLIRAVPGSNLGCSSSPELRIFVTFLSTVKGRRETKYNYRLTSIPTHYSWQTPPHNSTSYNLCGWNSFIQ